MTALLAGTYSTLVKKGLVFSAYATVTTPAVYNTAAGAGLGGPLLWNPPTNTVDAHIIAISAMVSTAATSSVGGLGWTSGVQVAAPTTTTAIDASGNMLVGGPSGQVKSYRIGTVSAGVAATTFMPLLQVDTGAITVSNMTPSWTILDGSLIVTPGNFGAVTGSVLFTTLVINIGLVWAEIPT
jgi:hypothetical protein